MPFKTCPRKMVSMRVAFEEALVRSERTLSNASVEGAKSVKPWMVLKTGVISTTWRASPRPVRLFATSASEKFPGGVRSLSMTRRVRFPTVVPLTTVALKRETSV